MFNKIISQDIDYIINENLEWEKLKNKTILISGANGLLASYLVYTLMKLNDSKGINCKIIGVVRNKAKACKKFAELLNRNDFKLVYSDVCKLNCIEDDIDIIIHAASQASPIYYKTDPVGTINANVLGTNNLLEIAKENNVEAFLYISSGEVYGITDENSKYIKEDDYGYINLTDIRSCYAESKRLGENMCVAWSNQYSVPCKIVRPFHTYGPGIDFKDGRVFADFISNIIENKNIIMKSDGSAERAFCYIADAILGFFYVLFRGEIAQAYNVGNDKGDISIRELATLLCNMFPEKGLKVIVDTKKMDDKYVKSPIKHSAPDISKMKMIGWTPKYSIEDGFYRTLVSYQNLTE